MAWVEVQVHAWVEVEVHAWVEVEVHAWVEAGAEAGAGAGADGAENKPRASVSRHARQLPSIHLNYTGTAARTPLAAVLQACTRACACTLVLVLVGARACA